MGYRNIKIYNGGIKDWKKSGFKIQSIEPLPDYEGLNISPDELLAKIKQADLKGCMGNGRPVLTIIDYRTENYVNTRKQLKKIKTACPTVCMLLDDMRKAEIRDLIPRDSLVVLVCETGNRDADAMKLLSKYGFNNIVGLKAGMRGWLKLNYPTISKEIDHTDSSELVNDHSLQ